MSLNDRSSSHDFISGGGETGAMIRALDWTATPLGPVADWPQSLRTLIGVMLGSSQPMFVCWGPDRILLYNDGYAEVLAGKHPAAMGCDFLDVWDEIRGDLIGIVARAYGGEPVQMDDIELLMHRRGYPEETHFAFSYTPVRDAGGAVDGFFCPCVEITEQVMAQRRRAADAARQRRLFEQAPGFMTILNGPDHVFEFANAAYRRIFGDRDYVGRAARAVFPEMAGQPFFDLLDHVYTQGERYVANGVTIRFARSDGGFDERSLDFIYEPVIDEHGRVTGIFVEGHDVTEALEGQAALRRSEAALRDSEARLRELNDTLEQQVAVRTAERDRMWNTSPDLLLAIDFDGVFRQVNPAWTTILGYRADELVGHHVNEFVIPEDHRDTVDAYEAAAGGGRPVIENRYRHKDGSLRRIAWVAAPAGDMTYATGRDVTGDHARAAELAAAQEQLRQAQKMEAVGQLTGGIAHDFNNLLTGVIGSLEMMQRRAAQGDAAAIERYATTAMTAANRAAALTHRLLAFSRRQPLDPKPVDANRLVTGMEDLLRRTIGERVALEVVTAGGLWQTLCDPHQLESAILNLAINARDAMPAGGQLTIETCNCHLDHIYAARQRDVRPGQYVCVCVTDTGSGMAKDVIDKAFEPFFTTKPIGQGTGLGLSMIYGFARQSEGYARIYSEVGRGTSVKLYLPRYHGAVETIDEPAALDEAAIRAVVGKTVLVVEDEPAVRGLVVDVLEDLGYRVVEAADGPAGLTLLQSDLRVDLLVTDIGLPGLNGRQVADAARRLRPDLQVLFMTGYAENATIANGFLDPGMQMITKPFAIDAIATRIRDMIEAG